MMITFLLKETKVQNMISSNYQNMMVLTWYLHMLNNFKSTLGKVV